MATAQARIYRTSNPAGFAWTFDRTDVSDGAIDNAATAANAGAAMNAVAALVTGLPGSIQSVILNIQTFE